MRATGGERIIDRERFVQFARDLNVRSDWHEPDEQGVTARVEGLDLNFDNAGFWPDRPGMFGHDRVTELHVIFSDMEIDDTGTRRRAVDIACVNLADLCAWASEAHPDAEAVAKLAFKSGARFAADHIVDELG
jgi:hypothetical protein